MAKEAKSFIVNQKNKTITIFTNVKANATEQKIIDFYLEHEYTPLFDKKKSGVRIEEMKKALKPDEEAYNEFMRLYKSKEKIIVDGKELTGFHAACRYYNEWNAKKNEK